MTCIRKDHLQRVARVLVIVHLAYLSGTHIGGGGEALSEGSSRSGLCCNHAHPRVHSNSYHANSHSCDDGNERDDREVGDLCECSGEGQNAGNDCNDHCPDDSAFGQATSAFFGAFFMKISSPDVIIRNGLKRNQACQDVASADKSQEDDLCSLLIIYQQLYFFDFPEVFREECDVYP
jgi:hypothetical protein